MSLSVGINSTPLSYRLTSSSWWVLRSGCFVVFFLVQARSWWNRCFQRKVTFWLSSWLHFQTLAQPKVQHRLRFLFFAWRSCPWIFQANTCSESSTPALNFRLSWETSLPFLTWFLFCTVRRWKSCTQKEAIIFIFEKCQIGTIKNDSGWS